MRARLRGAASHRRRRDWGDTPLSPHARETESRERRDGGAGAGAGIAGHLTREQQKNLAPKITTHNGKLAHPYTTAHPCEDQNKNPTDL